MKKNPPVPFVYKLSIVTMLLLFSLLGYSKSNLPFFPKELRTGNSKIENTLNENSISLNYTLSNELQLEKISIASLLFGLENSFEVLPPPIDSACTSTTADTFFINSVPDAISYDWIVPTGATYSQPIGDTAIIIDWTSAVFGIDSIGIAASNICGPGDTLFFPLRILNCNLPPIAIADNYTFPEDNSNVILDVQLNDSDPNGDLLLTTIISLPSSGGTASVISGASLSYSPPNNFNGQDTIIYQICDNAAIIECDVDTVFITINPVNDKPIAGNDSESTNEDTPVTILVVNNDSDPNDFLGNIDTSSIAIITAPNFGTTSINSTTGEITYSPNLNFNGSDTLYYMICDNGNPLPSKCDTAEVVISINPINDLIIAINDTTITGEEQLVTYNVLANDADSNDPAGGINVNSLNIISVPMNGIATVNASSGEISYTPAAGFHGLDSLVYEICDTGNPLPAICTTAKFFITVPTEDCTNGIDDDFDGLIDCDDPDCTVPTPGAITGNTIVCRNAVGETYSVPSVTGATSYTWTVPPDAIITAGQGTNSITITWGETDGDICVTATDGACISASTCLTIDTNILAPINNIFRN